MMKMNTSTRLALGFGVQILLAGVLGTSVLIGMAEVQRQFQFVAQHDAPVIANARQLSKLVVDMETGQRGFVITGKEEFLQPYHSGVEEFDTLIVTEKKLVSDNPPQVAALERIDALVGEWKEKAAGPEILMARKVATSVIDAEHLQDILAEGVGKDLMDRFMALAHELEAGFSEQGDWEGAYAVEVIEKVMTDREDGQRGFLITGQERFLEKHLAGEQKLPQFFGRLRALVAQRGRDDELSGRIDQLEELAAEWTVKAAEPEIAARREMNEIPETLKDVAALLQAGTGKALVDEIREELDAFIATEETLSARRYATATQTAASTRRSAILLLAIAVATGFAIALMTSRSIAHPLARLVRATAAVGRGDLATQVQTDASDEIGDLTRAFNAMVSHLAEVLSQEKELQGQLIASKERDRFINQLNHDLKTPLTPLVALLPLIEAEVSDPRINKMLKLSIDNVEFMRHLLEQTMNLSSVVDRDVEFDRKVLDLSGVIATSIASLTFQDNGDIRVIDNTVEAKIKGDALRLREVVDNVLANAVKYMGGAGTITVDVRQEANKTVVSIADTGVGMTDDQLAHVFDEFYKADASRHDRSSAGLGLSICKSIIERHGGRIWAESSGPGQGSRFHFSLPRAFHSGVDS